MINKRLHYEEPFRIPKEEVLEIVKGGKPNEITRILISITFYEEFEFASTVIFNYARSTDEAVRGIAILCVGHLARIHRFLPQEPTLKLISDALIDKSFYIRGQAENAADDIAVFVPGLTDKICEMIACLTDKSLKSAELQELD